MSLLPQEVHTALTQLLGALSSPDNNARSQAEERLNIDWWTNRPDVLLMGLVEQMQGSEDQTVSYTTFVSVKKIDHEKDQIVCRSHLPPHVQQDKETSLEQ